MPERERELTFAQAVREALAEEMRRDSRVCIFGEDVAEAGTPFKVLSGLVEEFGAERVVDTPISEAGFTGVGSRRGHDRPASRRRHHVRRFPHADHGSDGEPGRQSSLHVGRTLESSHGDAHHAGRDAALRGAAFAVAARLVQPRARIESRAAFDALRRQRLAEDRDSRRESRRLLRRQDDVQAEGPGARRGLHDSAWAWPT